MSANTWAQDAPKAIKGALAKAKQGWVESLRRDIYLAKRDAANSGWWSDLQDRWAEQELRYGRDD